MNNEINIKKNTYKYNLSFYYQSTIIYFVIFVFYVFVRGSFEEKFFKIFTNDPIIYFFFLIIVVSLIALIINVIRNKTIEVSEEGITITTRFKGKNIKRSDIEFIKLFKRRRVTKKNLAGAVRLKLKNRKRNLLIRTTDYENPVLLFKNFEELKKKIDGSNV